MVGANSGRWITVVDKRFYVGGNAHDEHSVLVHVTPLSGWGLGIGRGVVDAAFLAGKVGGSSRLDPFSLDVARRRSCLVLHQLEAYWRAWS